jgi:hypothetical protein
VSKKEGEDKVPRSEKKGTKEIMAHKIVVDTKKIKQQQLNLAIWLIDRRMMMMTMGGGRGVVCVEPRGPLIW